jgi:hypothetical protein
VGCKATKSKGLYTLRDAHGPCHVPKCAQTKHLRALYLKCDIVTYSTTTTTTPTTTTTTTTMTTTTTTTTTTTMFGRLRTITTSSTTTTTRLGEFGYGSRDGNRGLETRRVSSPRYVFFLFFTIFTNYRGLQVCYKPPPPWRNHKTARNAATSPPGANATG